jgi:hypothetical protein
LQPKRDCDAPARSASGQKIVFIGNEGLDSEVYLMGLMVLVWDRY